MRCPNLLGIGLTAAVVSALLVVPSPAESASAATAGTAVFTTSSPTYPAFDSGRQRFAIGTAVNVSHARLKGEVILTSPESKPGRGDFCNFTLEPPRNEELRLGRYEISVEPWRTDSATASVAVGSNNHGFLGDVEVLDLAADANGNLTRFDIAFRSGTATPSYAHFGQVRMGHLADTGVIPGYKTLKFPTTPKRIRGDQGDADGRQHLEGPGQARTRDG